MEILIIILIILVVIGILRVLLTPYEGFWAEVGKFFFVDLLIDVLGFLIELFTDID